MLLTAAVCTEMPAPPTGRALLLGGGVGHGFRCAGGVPSSVRGRSSAARCVCRVLRRYTRCRGLGRTAHPPTLHVRVFLSSFCSDTLFAVADEIHVFSFVQRTPLRTPHTNTHMHVWSLLVARRCLGVLHPPRATPSATPCRRDTTAWHQRTAATLHLGAPDAHETDGDAHHPRESSYLGRITAATTHAPPRRHRPPPGERDSACGAACVRCRRRDPPPRRATGRR